MAVPESIPRRKPRFRERTVAIRPQKPPPVVPAVALPPVRPRRGSKPVLHPQLKLEHALYAGLLVAGLALRLWDLGSRPMHGDEAEHAWFAWRLFKGMGYHYDPVYHGPLQFIVTAFFFFLFGVSNFTARLMAVLFGCGLIGIPYFLRHHMGRTAALVAAVLITFSPSFIYVSRLERDDIFSCFFSLLLAIALFSFLRTRHPRYIYLGAAATALSLASMENTYITLFVFGTFAIIAAASEMLSAHPYGTRLHVLSTRYGSRHVIGAAPLAALSALIAAAFALTIATGWYIPVPALVLMAVVLLVHRQFLLESIPSVSSDDSEEFHTEESNSPGERTPREVPPLKFFVDAFKATSRQHWLNGLTIVVAILFLAYSTFGTNLSGIWDSSQAFFTAPHACPNSYLLNPCRKDILGGLFYWLSQHHVHRGGQPWFYYGFLFGLYEQLILILGVGGILWFFRRPTHFTSFLIYWAVLAFAIYSWAGEKFPWLLIHPLMPFTLLAAVFSTELIRTRHAIRLPAFGLVGLLALLGLHSSYEVNYVHAADPVEMMVYVQSSPDTAKTASEILATSNKATNGNGLPVTIDAADAWPFAWYLRDMTHVQYPAWPQLLQRPYASSGVILVDETHQPTLWPQIKGRYAGQLRVLRWWFPEDYKSFTWKTFGKRMVDPGYWRVVTAWLLQRRPFGPKGDLHFYYYVKRGLVSPY